MIREQIMVRAFHRAFGHPSADVPTLPPLELAEKRVKWTIEELNEFLEAVEAGDLVGAYDAIIDAFYFIVGTADVVGVDIGLGFDIVHNANMAKLDPVTGQAIYGEDGKVRKPEGWQAPEPQLKALLEKMKRSTVIEQAAQVLSQTDSLADASEILGGKLSINELAQLSIRTMELKGDELDGKPYTPDPGYGPDDEQDPETATETEPSTDAV